MNFDQVWCLGNNLNVHMAKLPGPWHRRHRQSRFPEKGPPTCQSSSQCRFGFIVPMDPSCYGRKGEKHAYCSTLTTAHSSDYSRFETLLVRTQILAREPEKRTEPMSSASFSSLEIIISCNHIRGKSIESIIQQNR